MQLFNKIEGGVAVVRNPKGFLVQAELYSRGSQVFIKTGSGFLRISDRLGDAYLTVHTDYKVLELEGDGVKLEGNKAPLFISKSSSGWGK
jgi:hypothetical protein